MWAISRSYFFTDDYVLLTDALTRSFGIEYLLTPENGHLMPGTRAIYYAVAHIGGTDWTWAALVALMLQLAASISALWCLLVLFGARWGVVPLYVLYATSVMTAQAFMWWVSSVNQTAIAISFFVALGAWVNYLRTKRWSWLFATSGALLWGLLFFQKSLLVLPVLVFMMLAYFTVGGPLARLRSAVATYWPSALLIGALAAGYSAYLITQVPQPASRRSADWWELFELLVLRTFATGVTGGPSGWQSEPGGAWADPPAWQLLGSWVLIVGVVLTSALTRRRALRAWFLLTGYLVLLVLVIGGSRAGVFGNEIAAAYRLQTDALYVAVIALGLAFLPLQGSQESATPRVAAEGRAPDLTRWMIAVVLAVAVSGVGNWLVWVSDWERGNTSEAYVKRLGEDMQRLGKQDFVDRPVPQTILSRFFFGTNKLSTVAPLIAPGARFPEQTNQLSAVSPEGDVRHVNIKASSRSVEGSARDCGWLVRSQGATIPLSAEAHASSSWMRIGYLTGQGTPLEITAGTKTIHAQLPSGLGSLFAKVDGPFDEVRLGGVDEGVTVCVGAIEVGAPQLGDPR